MSEEQFGIIMEVYDARKKPSARHIARGSEESGKDNALDVLASIA